MFIFMGNMLEAAGIAKALYDMMYKWMGGLKGGLAIGTVAICAVFAAMVGCQRRVNRLHGSSCFAVYVGTPL